MSEIDTRVARKIIEKLGGPGIPPEHGFQFFTSGLEPYISVIEQDYLSSFVPDGGSAFKMVVGVYGGGKTHFLYCVRDLAWKHGFAVSYVSLGPEESPFHRLDRVYAAIVRGLIPPLPPEELLSGYEQGISSFLRRWYAQEFRRLQTSGVENEAIREELLAKIDRIGGIESISFARAIAAAFRALADRQDEDFNVTGQPSAMQGRTEEC